MQISGRFSPTESTSVGNTASITLISLSHVENRPRSSILPHDAHREPKGLKQQITIQVQRHIIELPEVGTPMQLSARLVAYINVRIIQRSTHPNEIFTKNGRISGK